MNFIRGFLIFYCCLCLPVLAQTEQTESSTTEVQAPEQEQPQPDSESPTVDDGPPGWRERFKHLKRTGEVSPGNLPQVPVDLKEDYFRLLNGNLWLKPGGFVELDLYLDQGDPVGLFAFAPSLMRVVASWSLERTLASLFDVLDSAWTPILPGPPSGREPASIWRPTFSEKTGRPGCVTPTWSFPI